MATGITRETAWIGIIIVALATLIISALALLNPPRTEEHVYGTEVVSAAELEALGTGMVVGDNNAGEQAGGCTVAALGTPTTTTCP